MDAALTLTGAAALGWGLAMIFDHRDGGWIERAGAIGLIAALTALAIAFIGAHDYARALRAAASIALLGIGLEAAARRARAAAASAPEPRGEGASPFGHRWRRTRRPRPYHLQGHSARKECRESGI